MRDYFIVLIVLTSVPIGLLRPFYGFMVYAWISYMYPHMLAWSFAQSFPSAKLMAATTIVGTVLRRAADVAALRQRESVMLILLWLWFTLTTLFAVYPDKALLRWQYVSKVILMGLVAAALLSSQ